MVNYLAVFTAAALGFISGGIWYGVLGNAWAKALGKEKNDFKPEPKPFIIGFICQLIMAYILAGLIGHLGFETIWEDIICALFVWAGS